MVKNLPVNAGEVGSIPGSGRSPGVGNDNPLQCSSMGNHPWTEEPGAGYFPWGCKELDLTE